MDAIASQIRELASTTDDAGRKRITDTLSALIVELKNPYEHLFKIMLAHAQIAAVRIANDLDLIVSLSQNKTPLSVKALAEKTGAAPEFLARILRFLASFGTIKETGMDEFTSNNLTHFFADEKDPPDFPFATPPHADAPHPSFDNVGPTIQALPNFLISTRHQNIISNTNCTFQAAFSTDLPVFRWLPTQPVRFANFQKCMKVVRSGSWLDVFPLRAEFGAGWAADAANVQRGADRAVFVDVGGSLGQQCVDFRTRYPAAEVKGCVILQELPETLAFVDGLEGVETMVQDFWEVQAVQGAKFYYFRTILHDYPDEVPSP